MAVSTLPVGAHTIEEFIASDADLVAAAIDDPRAFAIIYRQYVTSLYQYCYRYLGSQEFAEDATSQSFAQALANLGKFRGDQLRPWLFSIAHNVVVDVLRKQRPSISLDSIDIDSASDSNPELAVIASDADARLRQVIASLPARERQIVELRLAGLSGAEIAAALHCSHSAVRTAHHRAIQRMRDVLHQEEM